MSKDSSTSIAKQDSIGLGIILKNSKLMGTIAFVLVGLFIATAQPFSGLASQGHNLLAALLRGAGVLDFQARRYTLYGWQRGPGRRRSFVRPQI